jgi:c-di-GMP-binding flagellar brake protein YcgR
MREQDRRNHPRIDLLAQVQVTRASEVHILSTQNISVGGLFVQADPAEMPEVKRGVELEIVIFHADEELAGDVAARARVVRIVKDPRPGQPAGFGLQFQSFSPGHKERLQTLLRSLRGLR